MAELRSDGRSVDMLETPRDGAGDEGSPGAYELVVARDPSADELRRAAGRVAPGGALVVEMTGRRRAAAALARSLSRLGFEGIRAHWHWPSIERCTRIVPLDDPTALRYSFSRSGRSARARLGAWVGRGLLSTGLLRWGVTGATVIGRRAPRVLEAGGGAARPGGDRAGDPPARSVIHAFLAARKDRLALVGEVDSRRLSFVVLTPRFRNSSHLVFLLLPEGGHEPVLVAKLPRLPGRGESIEREAERLREIQAYRPAGFDSIPRVVAFEPWGGRKILVQTALPGNGMDRATVRKDAPRCCEAALAWLVELQAASRRSPDPDGGGAARLLERDLLELGRLFPAEERLFGRTRELLGPLASAGLTSVLEHRDLSHPNIIVGREGRVAVIDWEQAELRGLPAVDLYFFLAYVAMALRGARSPAAAVAALDDAFFRPRSWTRTYVERYAQALDVPRHALRPLFVACWVRQVAGLAGRVARGDATPDAETAAFLRRDWRFGVWRHAVEQANRLEWGDAPAGAISRAG